MAKKRPVGKSATDTPADSDTVQVVLADPPAPDDATIRDACRKLIDGMFLDRMHPMAREGLRRYFPELLGLIPGPTAARVLQIWEEEARL